LAETELAEALPALTEATSRPDPKAQAVGRAGLLRIADGLNSRGRKNEAGQAYLAVLKSAIDDAERRRAIEGLAACPIPDAFEAVRQTANSEALQAPTAQALIAIGGALTAADRKKDAVAAFELAGRLDNSPEAMKRIAVGMREAGAAADYAA